jgi:hypothetical protein
MDTERDIEPRVCIHMKGVVVGLHHVHTRRGGTKCLRAFPETTS